MFQTPIPCTAAVLPRRSLRAANAALLVAIALFASACGGGGSGTAAGPGESLGAASDVDTTASTTDGREDAAARETLAGAGEKARVPLSITSQPGSLIVASGAPAAFVVKASSSTPASYQWFRDGDAIEGAKEAKYLLATTRQADNGARFTVRVNDASGSVTSAAARLTVNMTAAIIDVVPTALRPFSDRSPWNARPSRFTLGTTAIPAALYTPTVAEGAFSVGVFATTQRDPMVTVVGPAGSNGIYVADSQVFVPQIVIPHWPAGVAPASGGDGHADIVDAAANRIHSFYQLRLENGQWRAAQYTWTTLDGRGWGTPGGYAGGSRAAGVVTMAGLIRKHEVDDDELLYKHALAMSLTYNALASRPTYVFPATTADHDAATSNSGSIPMGALMMLPATYNVTAIRSPRLQKIARTLQAYGAYVVDRNDGTPFVIYAEIGTNYNLMPNGWDNDTAAELDRMRAAIRQVVAVSEWVDAKGAVFTPETNLNLLSMRGFWWPLQGGTAASFDTWEQAVVFPSDGRYVWQVNAGGSSMPKLLWGQPVAGRSYKLKVEASGAAIFRLDLVSATGQTLFTTGNLQDGAAPVIVWPAGDPTPHTYAGSGPQGGGKVSATLVAL